MTRPLTLSFVVRSSFAHAEPLDAEFLDEDRAGDARQPAAQPASAYLEVALEPHFDGVPLPGVAGLVFDGLEVLCRGSTPGEFYPFTCSCGVPGCAGIHDEARLERDATQIRWVLPRSAFEHRVSPAMLPQHGDIVLCFDRAQYRAALAQAKRDICALEAHDRMPVLLAPCPFVTEQCLARHRGAAAELKAARKVLVARERAARARRAQFGELWDMQVRVSLPGVGSMTAWAVNFAEEQAWSLAQAQGLDQYQQELVTVVLPRMRAGAQALAQWMQALGPQVLEGSFWPDGQWARNEKLTWPPAAGDDLTQRLAARWPHVQVTLEPQG